MNNILREEFEGLFRLQEAGSSYPKKLTDLVSFLNTNYQASESFKDKFLVIKTSGKNYMSLPLSELVVKGGKVGLEEPKEKKFLDLKDLDWKSWGKLRELETFLKAAYTGFDKNPGDPAGDKGTYTEAQIKTYLQDITTFCNTQTASQSKIALVIKNSGEGASRLQSPRKEDPITIQVSEGSKVQKKDYTLRQTGTQFFQGLGFIDGFADTKLEKTPEGKLTTRITYEKKDSNLITQFTGDKVDAYVGKTSDFSNTWKASFKFNEANFKKVFPDMKDADLTKIKEDFLADLDKVTLTNSNGTLEIKGAAFSPTTTTIIEGSSTDYLEGYLAYILSKNFSEEGTEIILPVSENFPVVDIFIHKSGQTEAEDLWIGVNCKLGEGNRNSRLLTILRTTGVQKALGELFKTKGSNPFNFKGFEKDSRDYFKDTKLYKTFFKSFTDLGSNFKDEKDKILGIETPKSFYFDGDSQEFPFPKKSYNIELEKENLKLDFPTMLSLDFLYHSLNKKNNQKILESFFNGCFLKTGEKTSAIKVKVNPNSTLQEIKDKLIKLGPQNFLAIPLSDKVLKGPYPYKTCEPNYNLVEDILLQALRKSQLGLLIKVIFQNYLNSLIPNGALCKIHFQGSSLSMSPLKNEEVSINVDTKYLKKLRAWNSFVSMSNYSKCQKLDSLDGGDNLTWVFPKDAKRGGTFIGLVDSDLDYIENSKEIEDLRTQLHITQDRFNHSELIISNKDKEQIKNIQTKKDGKLYANSQKKATEIENRLQQLNNVDPDSPSAYFIKRILKSFK